MLLKTGTGFIGLEWETHRRGPFAVVPHGGRLRKGIRSKQILLEHPGVIERLNRYINPCMSLRGPSLPSRFRRRDGLPAAGGAARC